MVVKFLHTHLLSSIPGLDCTKSSVGEGSACDGGQGAELARRRGCAQVLARQRGCALDLRARGCVLDLTPRRAARGTCALDLHARGCARNLRARPARTRLRTGMNLHRLCPTPFIPGEKRRAATTKGAKGGRRHIPSCLSIKSSMISLSSWEERLRTMRGLENVRSGLGRRWICSCAEISQGCGGGKELDE